MIPMIDKTRISEVLESQKDEMKLSNYVNRDIKYKKYLNLSEILVIIGPRRSGKSTFMKYIANKYDKKIFINFEDERLISIETNDLDTLLLLGKKVYGDTKILFFDEIQSVDYWEKFVRRLYREGYKIFITGSNTKNLRNKLAETLTGRYFKILVLPFSFKEILRAKGITFKNKKQDYPNMLRAFDNYLYFGGFPKYVLTNDKEYIKMIYEDILYKDVIQINNVRNERAIKELPLYLANAMTKELTYSSAAKTLGLDDHSVKNYISYLENAFIVKVVDQYNESSKKRIKTPKKIYFIDNGLRNILVPNRYKDKGNLLENLVFIQLFRNKREIYYFKKNKECDFITIDKEHNFQAIQVTYELNDQNKDREIKGLLEAMKFFKLKEGLLLTYDQEYEIKVKDKDGKTRKIIVKPVWKWLLE